jgi:hypothetical protein
VTPAEIEYRPSEPRRAEAVRLLVIFAVLAALIAVPWWLWQRHERRRPTLAEARVVSASSTDPVFREGTRTVAADEAVELAVALRLEYPEGSDLWLSPVDQLMLDGRRTDHRQSARWPEEDRRTRVFWFTLEAPVLGGSLSADTRAAKLTYRSFLAPELGHDLLAEGEPQSHADDGVNLGNALVPVDAGTYRVYARVEVVEANGGTHALQVATTLGADDLDSRRMVRISRQLRPDLGLHPAAGELFRLPGFEPDGDDEPVGVDLISLAARHLAVSSEIFAAMAVTGAARFEDGGLEPIARLVWTDDTFGSGSGPLRWGPDVRPRDLVVQGEHWMVLVGDDGDDLLGPRDTVAHCWRRPPALLPLGDALEDEPARARVMRIARGPR